MRKNIKIMVIAVLCLLVLPLLGCAERSNDNDDYDIGNNTLEEQEKVVDTNADDTENTMQQAKETGDSNTDGNVMNMQMPAVTLATLELRSIEELENALVVSRLIEMIGDANDASSRIDELRSLYNISARNFSHILNGNLIGVNSLYIPTIQFDGFEIFLVSARSMYNGIYVANYFYMPIGGNHRSFSHVEGIHIRLENLASLDLPDVLAPIVEQTGIELTEDGLFFEDRRHLGYNDLYAQIGDIRMSLTIPHNLAISSYEAMREIALSEFIPANIVSVDEMIERRLRSREVLVTFFGKSDVTIEHFTNAEWVSLGAFNNAHSFTVPFGTTHIRATSSDTSHTFAIPADDHFTPVFSFGTSGMNLSGVSATDGNVHITYEGGVVTVPAPASVLFPSGNDREYFAVLLSRAGGYFPFVTTAQSMAGFSQYLYDVVVPSGISNVRLIVDRNDIVNGVGGGSTITLLRTGQPAGMAFTFGGTMHSVNFTLDGSDPFAGFRW